MQIVESSKVQQCYLIKDNIKVQGLIYQDRFFSRIASYPQEESQEAIRRGRQEFLANKGLVLVIVVEEQERCTVWIQDDTLTQPLPTLKPERNKKDKPQKSRTKQPQAQPIISKIPLEKLIINMSEGQGGLEVKDRRHKFKLHPNCFLGSEAVLWLIQQLNISSQDAIKIGQQLIAEKWIDSPSGETEFNDSNSSFYQFYWYQNPHVRTAHIALYNLSLGLAKGKWDNFLAMLSDDFTFWFPAGQFKGENKGKDAAAKFFHYVSDKVFPQGLSVRFQGFASNDNRVIFEIESKGLMLGQPYENQGAIAFEVRDRQICSYREYLSVIYSFTST